MKYFVWLCALLLIAEIAFAQGEIRGRARDNTNNGSIVGATVYVLPQNNAKNTQKMMTVTKEDGEFIFQGVPDGIYDLECYAPGFVTQRIVGFQIKSGQTKLAYFRMKTGSATKQGIDIVETYAALQSRQKSKITTASQTEEALLDAPATVYLITQKDIEERGYQSVVQALEDIPEIEVHEKSDPEVYNTITVRGIHGNERLLILIDGIRISSGASTFHAIDHNFPIHYVDHIEVLIGQVSSIYGADAFNGVVNIITKKGNQIRGGAVQASYGMYNTTNNAAILGFGDKDINATITGSYYRSKEPYIPKFYAEDYDSYLNQYLTNGTVLLSPFSTDTTHIPIQPYDMHREAFSASARVFIYGLEIGLSHRQEMHSSTTGTLPQLYPILPGSRYGSSLSNAYLRYKFKSGNNKWSVEPILHWNYFEIKPNSKFNNSFSGYQDAYKFAFDNNSLLQALVSYKINAKHRIAYQLSGKYIYALPKTSDLPFQWTRGQDASGLSQYYLGTNLVDKDSTDLRIYQELFFMSRYNISSSVQYQGDLSEKFSIFITTRSDYNSDYGFSFNPRLALIYKPSDELRLKLFYGESFLAPSPQKEYDQFGDLKPILSNNNDVVGFEGGFWRLPNNQLLPEKLRSVELAATYAKGNLVLTSDLYTSYASNLIVYELSYNQVFRGIEIAVAEKPQNTGKAFYFGGNVNANYNKQFGKENEMELNIWASLSYSSGSAKDTTGKYILIQPYLTSKLNGKLGAVFRYKDFSVSVRAIMRSPGRAYNTISDETEVIPAFARINCSAKYRVLSKKANVSLFVNVQNATNARYYNGTLSGIANFGVMPQDPIRVTGGVEVTFRTK